MSSVDEINNLWKKQIAAGIQAPAIVKHRGFPYHKRWAFEGDQVDNYYTIPDETALDLTGDFTLAMWIYLKDTLVGQPVQVHAKKGAITSWEIFTWNHDFIVNQINWRIFDSLNHSFFGQIANYTGDTWVHWVLTFDDSEARMKRYQKGLLKTNTVDGLWTSPIRLNTDVVSVGATDAGTGLIFADAKVASFALWSDILTPTEVKNLHDFNQHPLDNLILRHDIGTNSGQTTTIPDLSGNGRDGVINDVTWNEIQKGDLTLNDD